MNDTTKNFWEIWNAWDYQPPKPPVFRCYHREDGSIITYSTELLEHAWIEIDAATFVEQPTRALVRNGELQRLPSVSPVNKLRPSDQGQACDPSNITVVVHSNQPCTKWKLTNETN